LASWAGVSTPSAMTVRPATTASTGAHLSELRLAVRGPAGDHAYRSRPGPADPRRSGRPRPDAGDGPWTVEFAVEVIPLDA
jgi:hypothetical protein